MKPFFLPWNIFFLFICTWFLTFSCWNLHFSLVWNSANLNFSGYSRRNIKVIIFFIQVWNKPGLEKLYCRVQIDMAGVRHDKIFTWISLSHNKSYVCIHRIAWCNSNIHTSLIWKAKRPIFLNKNLVKTASVLWC